MKDILFDLYKELEVTKEEALQVADMIENGKLNGNWYINRDNEGCLMGLVSLVRNEITEENYRNWNLPERYDLLSYSDKYSDLEHLIEDKSTHENVLGWVREYAE